MDNAPFNQIAKLTTTPSGGVSLQAGNARLPLYGSIAQTVVSAATQAELDAVMLSVPALDYVTVNLTGRSYSFFGLTGDYSRWQFVGIPPVPLSSTSVVSVTGSGTARIMTLQMGAFDAAALDIAVGDWLCLDQRPSSDGGPTMAGYPSQVVTAGAGTNYQSLYGAWEISAVDDVNNRISVKLKSDTDCPSPAGALSAYWLVIKTKFLGFAVDSGYVGKVQNVKIDTLHLDKASTVFATTPNIFKSAYLGDSCYLHAELCSFGSSNVNYNAFLRADYAVFYSEDYLGLGLYLENQANATVEGAFFNGCRVHVTHRSFATLQNGVFANSPEVVRAVAGGYVGLYNYTFVNVGATPTVPTLDTATTAGEFITTTAPAN